MLLPIIKRFRAGLEKLDLIDHAGWFDNHEGEPHKRVRVLLKDGSEFKGYHGYDLFESEENGYEAFYVIGSHVAWANTGGIVVFEDGRRDIPIQDIKKLLDWITIHLLNLKRMNLWDKNILGFARSRNS